MKTSTGLVHNLDGCGMIDSIAGGELFLGHSGAGKSTTTRIWQSARNPMILSDDRIILRLENGALRMYGTPWHGEAAFAEQGMAALKRIFILQHGPRNKIKPLSKAQAVGEVFARSFPPFHSASGLDGALERVGPAEEGHGGNVTMFELRVESRESRVTSEGEAADSARWNSPDSRLSTNPRFPAAPCGSPRRAPSR